MSPDALLVFKTISAGIRPLVKKVFKGFAADLEAIRAVLNQPIVADVTVDDQTATNTDA